MLYALILAGGKGTRLYPLSRANNPKQFLKLINNKSFLRNTVDRIKPLVDKDNIYVVTNEDYVDKVKAELSELASSNIIVEPENKETATCIGLSAVKLLKRDKDAVLMVFPSDHYINKEKLFLDTLEQAVEICERKRGIVTIGIQPTRPETGYGYIQMGDRLNNVLSTYKVERFTEKPNVMVAKDFLMQGNYLWNSGMFIMRADVLLREIEKYLPKLYKSLIEIYQHIGLEDEEEVIKHHYNLIDGISIDFGVMQKTRKAYVIKCEFEWDDIGTFESLSRFLKNFRQNKVIGTTYTEDSENCTIIANDKLVIGFGIKDLVIVESDDVVLIMDKSKDQEIKHLVNNMKNDAEVSKYV
ncbi:MAG: mannose-1-phosphate guanylyltransferase [Clostridiales bacterium]|uniref:mannose-1-phosphate guanylyltransferase n=1 Tax=Clostridium sp. N3C TaxID=1776758 RepID=UPI00092E0D5E|nr:mannose-1-phosphate guanylyltransferase [Clostridium sp. N3C]NLZ47917.1 mannose-1-phosphate guanylyltransferase [Clostridiales bacterium]SCN26388.1 Alginate biosynthesis protein AlgA [Clostridium sp. N3C]